MNSIIDIKYIPGEEYTINDETVIYIGKNGNKQYFYRQAYCALTNLGTHRNDTTSVDVFEVTKYQGSEYGFSEKFGIEVTAIIGANIGFNIGQEWTIKGEISFSKAFSESVAQTVIVNVNPGITTTVFGVQISVEYWIVESISIFGQEFPIPLFYKSRSDLIDTGHTKSVDISEKKFKNMIVSSCT